MPRARTPWLALAGAAVVAIAAGWLALAGRGHRRGDGGAGGGDDRRAGSAIVEIVSTPAGAQVREDGVLRGQTPIALPVTPGREVVIELERPGYQRVWRVITASAGEPVSLHAELVPVPPGLSPPVDAGVP